MVLFFSERVWAQGVHPQVHAGWGTNLLFSPAADLRTSPGRTGYFGAALSIGGGDGKISFRPALSFSAAAYRTRMAYKIHFVSRRAAVDLDLVAAFPQMNNTHLIAGVFGGVVTEASAYVEQQGRDVFQGLSHQQLQRGHHALPNRAGLVVGMSIPLSRAGRLVLDLRLRQHLIPLVEQDQSYTLVFEPEQQVLSTSTLPTELTLGLSLRFTKQDE